MSEGAGAVQWRVGFVIATAWVALTACASSPEQGGRLPLTQIAAIALPGDPVRFDYAALDAEDGHLFIAHMGAGELVDVDIGARRVVRTVPNLPDVHGVIVVPDKHRVYATATGRNQLVAIDESSGREVFRAPTGTYPDGLAYNPVRHEVWTTNESAGTETVIDGDTGTVRATVPLGGEVGNVVYDALRSRMVVTVQGRNDVAIIDATSYSVAERISTPGCDHPHGAALDDNNQVMFVGCEANATMTTVDLTGRKVIDHGAVGETPDVLAYDSAAHRIYVAAESGWVSVFDHDRGRLVARGSAHLADGAHSITLDGRTRHVYFPLAKGPNGSPVLLEFAPAT